jgi:hypothetical protein
MQTYLFFLDKLSALLIEIIVIIISIVGIIFTLYGIKNIPFYVDKIIFLKLFTLNILFLSLIIFISLIFIILRKLLLINTLLNKCCYYISIILISLSILGFMTHVISGIFIINNMYFYNVKTKKNNIKNNINKLTSKEWVNTILIITFLFLIYAILIFLALSDNLRINLRIDDSYYLYQLAIEEEMNSQRYSKSEFKLNNKKNNGLNKKIETKENIKIIDEQISASANELERKKGNK